MENICKVQYSSRYNFFRISRKDLLLDKKQTNTIIYNSRFKQKFLVIADKNMLPKELRSISLTKSIIVEKNIWELINSHDSLNLALVYNILKYRMNRS